MHIVRTISAIIIILISNSAHCAVLASNNRVDNLILPPISTGQYFYQYFPNNEGVKKKQIMMKGGKRDYYLGIVNPT